MAYFIPERYKTHPDVIDYQLEGDAFQAMLRRRSDEWLAKPIDERPPYIVPDQWGSYDIRPGDWFSGTGHLLRWPFLAIKRSVCDSDQRWDFAKSVLCTKGPFPTIPTLSFVAIRLDDYLRYGCKITDHNSQYSYFNELVPLDDCLTDISNGWAPRIRYWKIPEPDEVVQSRKGQLTLF